MTDDEMATILVQRRADGWRDRLREYRVVLDGQEVGRLRPGRRCELSVTPGTHELEVRIDWAGSGSHEVVLAPGESVEYECRNRPGWSTIVRAFTNPDSYLELQQTSPGA
jgi:hypothetical protein